MKIYPAILTGDPLILQEQVTLSEEFEGCEVVQVDIIDGLFADALTVTPTDLVYLQPNELRYDLHLMTVDPEDFVNEACDVADHVRVRSVIAQVERMGNELSFVDRVVSQGWQAGLSLDLHTDIEEIDPDVWKELAIVQVMGIKAGAQGQKFEAAALDTLRKLEQLRREQELRFELIVDGGMTEEIIAKVKRSVPGTDAFAVGSLLWTASSPDQQWTALQDLPDSQQ